jgi:hypothetical protein
MQMLMGVMMGLAKIRMGVVGMVMVKLQGTRRLIVTMLSREEALQELPHLPLVGQAGRLWVEVAKGVAPPAPGGTPWRSWRRTRAR